ncbi:MAG: efflux RND transporter periplasmic adaptor subunit [Mariprofundaceae bacterium]
MTSIRILMFSLFLLMLPLSLQAAENPPEEPQNDFFSVEKDSAINGRVRAVHHAELSSVMDARIKRISVQEGSGFRKGDLLIEFDCALEKAELSRADATYKTAKERAKISQELVELDSISQLELLTAKSEAVKARAEQKIWQEKVRRCRIYAPYDGHVAAMHVQPYEYARAGEKLMKILDDTQFEVEALIPSNWLTSMSMGMPFSLVINETGMTYQAAVKNIGAEIDSVSETVKLVGIIQGDTRGLIAGMSGRLIMPFSEGGR